MRRRIIAICLTFAAAASLAAVPGCRRREATKHAKAAADDHARHCRCASSVGEKLTIRGNGFKAEARKNTVIFRAPNGRSAFAKPSQGEPGEARRDGARRA